jgi:hypothetical protein
MTKFSDPGDPWSGSVPRIGQGMGGAVGRDGDRLRGGNTSLVGISYFY